MANTQSMQIFLESQKEESDILEVLGITIGFLVESTEIEIPNAVGFAQISCYTQGFEQGILITWPSSVDLALPTDEIAKNVAIRLHVSILLEPAENGLVWLLAKSDGTVINANINYLDDGIELAQ